MTLAVKARLLRARRSLTRRQQAQPAVEELRCELGELVDSGAPPEALVGNLRQLTEVAGFERASKVAEQVINRVEGMGDLQGAVRLGAELARSVDGRYGRLAHATALRCGDVDAAEDVASDAQGQPWMTPGLATRFAVQRSLAAHDVPTALRLLGQLPRPLDRLDSRLHLRALEAAGHFDEVLAFVRSPDHRLEPATATLHEADALRWLGQADAAAELVTQLAETAVDDTRVVARMRDWGLAGDAGPAVAARLREIEQQTTTAEDLAKLVGLYFELDRYEDAARVARAIEAPRCDDAGPGIAPATRLVLARYHGAIGDFDRALELLDSLMRTPKQVEAQKLRARIQLEMGDVAEALATSSACPRPHGFMDEVSFSALMYLRRYREAFALAPNPLEWKPFVAVYGDRAEVDGTDLSYVRSRFVIAQGGPGDGIRFAATYPQLRKRSDELVITCDPRLLTLLQRSCPGIEFVPVERFNVRRPGGCGPDSPPRSGDVLYEWMTAEASDRAAQCDQVVLERSLYPLSLDGAPYAAYLQPRAELVDELSQWWPGAGRRVGVVWRSELRGPRREVQYLSASEAAQLFRPDDVVVCLQHDASALEREQLAGLSAARVEFVDDIDLRNDFESTAALVASLDVVVGVDTTMSELSGAVGTKTVFLQPSYISAWRGIDGAGHDYWYQSMRDVMGDPPSDRSSLLDRGRSLLNELA